MSTKRDRPEPKQTRGTYVDINRIYTIAGLCAALGIEQRVVREARANGLRAKLFGGRRVVIRGADVDEWLKTQAADAPLPKGNSSDERTDFDHE